MKTFVALMAITAIQFGQADTPNHSYLKVYDSNSEVFFQVLVEHLTQLENGVGMIKKNTQVISTGPCGVIKEKVTNQWFDEFSLAIDSLMTSWMGPIGKFQAPGLFDAQKATVEVVNTDTLVVSSDDAKLEQNDTVESTLKTLGEMACGAGTKTADVKVQKVKILVSKNELKFEYRIGCEGLWRTVKTKLVMACMFPVKNDANSSESPS